MRILIERTWLNDVEGVEDMRVKRLTDAMMIVDLYVNA
jgi:hypothetical protein